MPHLIGGIDPGVGGGLALITADGARLVDARKMPVLQAEGKTGKRIVDLPSLIGVFTDWVLAGVTIVMLERVRSMPRDGHVGAFAFGRCFGSIEMGLVAAGLRYVPVPPQTWKRKMNVQADKDHARATASQLFPDGAHHWRFKNQDGLAEAALLALYGAKHHA